MNEYKNSTNKEKIEEYYAILGCIEYNGKYNFYLMPIAWWILDYKKYDPENTQVDDFNFRNNIYTLTKSNKNAFLNSISDYSISLAELKDIISYYNNLDYEFDSYGELFFYIDFDNNNYIYKFNDIELEDYLPNDWTGKFDEPLKYLPKNLQEIWC